MNRRMAGLAAALILMTLAPIHTHAALRRVPEGMKTEQGEWTTKSKKDKEKDEESWQQEMLDSVNAARKKAGSCSFGAGQEDWQSSTAPRKRVQTIL